MKTIERKVYVAFDGIEFATAAECRAHEKDEAPKMLVGLTAEQIDAALTRENADLADAIERTAYLISTSRKAAGDLKRRPRGDPENGQGASSEGSAAGAAGDDPAPAAPSPSNSPGGKG